MLMPSGMATVAYGRGKERSLIMGALDRIGTSDGASKEVFLLHGGPRIGKTTLIRHVSTEIKRLELPGVVALGLDDRYTYDFFDKLLELAKIFRSPPFNYNTDAFDFAALQFDLQFRGGRNSSKALAASNFGSSQLVSSSITDALKEGNFDLVDEIGKTGLWGLIAGGAVGIAAGAALAAAAKAALVGGVAISSVHGERPSGWICSEDRQLYGNCFPAVSHRVSLTTSAICQYFWRKKCQRLPTVVSMYSFVSLWIRQTSWLLWILSIWVVGWLIAFLGFLLISRKLWFLRGRVSTLKHGEIGCSRLAVPAI
jgi:hypothetical protein